ncbi:preprotein translocase subunit SecA, partial [Nocardia niwae]|uniref:preprotein translocase subunit SecA n=1 Tax=Nocardia niwae TaxID=626084 RepID=UPI000A87469F
MVAIPDYFPDWLTTMVLGHFPEGDPEAMRRTADAWSDAANTLLPVLHRLEAALEQLDKAVEGETGTAMREQYRKIIDQIQAQIDFNNAMARQLYDNATAIEYQQYVIIGIAGALLAQVIIDMAMPPPGSIVKAVADRAEARAGMELAKRDLVLSMLAKAARFVAEHPRLMLATKGVFFGTAIGGGVPYVAQRVQIAQGHREKVDWQQVRIGAAAGAVGGLVGVEVGRRIAPAAIRAGGRVLGTVAAGGVGGMAGGLAGGLTAWGLTGGEMRGKDLATMVWTGFGSGLVGSVGASVRAARAGAYTGAPEPVSSTDPGSPPDAAPLAGVSAPGDGQPPQTQSATAEPVSTTSQVDAPGSRRSAADFGDGSADWDMPDAIRAEGDQILRDLFNDLPEGPERDALVAFIRGDGPGQLPDGSGGITSPGSTPDPSGGPSHPSSPGRGGSWPAWGNTPAARAGSSVAVAAPPEAGPGTTIPSRQFQISDPQVRPDQQGIDVLTEGTVTQPDIPTFGAEVLDGSSTYTDPLLIEYGPAGEMYLVTPEQTTGNASQDIAGPMLETLEEGATTQEGLLPELDVDASIAKLEAALAQDDAPASADTTALSVTTPNQAGNATSPPSAHTGTDNVVAGDPQPAPDAPPAVSAAIDTPEPGAQAGAAIPMTDAAPAGYAAARPEAHNPVVASNAANAAAKTAVPATATPAVAAATPAAATTPAVAGPPAAAGPPATTSGSSHTGGPKPPVGPTPPSGSQNTGQLAGHTPNAHGPMAHTSAQAASTSATSQVFTTPSAPTAAAGRPGDDEPDADPEEFPTPPGTVVDDPREHNVQKDPREHSVWRDPRDHSVQKKPAGDYVTIPGVSYPLEDEPPADAIPVIPRPPALTPLPVDSVGLGRAFENPGDSDSASPRPPDIVNPLSDRHVAAPETGLDAGLDKPPASLTMPSRYATEPNPETPGAPQPPAQPQLNPHSLEYHQDPSRLPAVGGVPHLQPVPRPSGKTEHKRLIAQMGGGDKPRRRKKQPPPEPEPTPTPPQPTPEPPPPVPRPKPRKRVQPPTPPVPEQLVEREAGEATGTVGDKGQHASTTARDGSDRKRRQSGVRPEQSAGQPDQRSLLQRAQQGDPEAFSELREQYGLDILQHVRRALGVSGSQSTEDEQSALTAGAINGTVFRFAEQQRWPVPAGEDVGSWLRRVADDAVVQSGVLEGMPDTAAGESAELADLGEVAADSPLAIESSRPVDATTDVGRFVAPLAHALGAASEAAIGPPVFDNAAFATPDDRVGEAEQDLPPADNSPELEQGTDQVVDAMRQAAEAVLADYHARSGPDIPEAERLTNVSPATLAEMLRGDDADATAAVIEVIRRGEGKILRWTQVAAVTAMRRVPVNMDAGEGKSLVFLAHAIREAIEHGAVQVITTRDNLANREVTRYVTVLAEYGIDVVRMNPDHAPRHPEPGRPTIYIGTQQDVGFAALRDNWVPGRSAAIDEIDEALIHADTQYILSDGADQFADPATAAQVTDARDFLIGALRDNNLTEADFGRTPGQRGGPARLTEDGRQKLEQLLGRAATEAEFVRIAMAAAARWEYVENVHYVVHNDRVFIIDQTTHKVLFDPQTSSESRWNGGLAQAVEAEHGLRIRNDPASSKSITAQQLFSRQNYDHVTGASGTAEGSATQLQQRYGMGEVAKIDRFHESQLIVHPDNISPDEASKLKTAAADIKIVQESGRPQLVLADRNDLVDPLSALLDDLDVAHTAVDAKWFLDHGTDAEAELQKIFDHAGEQGKVLVINMQGARGVDIPISDAIRDLGGLHVVVTGRSARSHDIDIQAENRSARNGDPGSARYYTSPEDDLYALSPHPLVQTVVVQYTRVAAEHQTQPTPETESALNQAEDSLRALVDPLQEFAALLHRHTHSSTGPTADPATRGPPATPTDRSARQPQHPPPIGFQPPGSLRQDAADPSPRADDSPAPTSVSDAGTTLTQAESADIERPRHAPEEQRFLEWYRGRLADRSGLPRQSLAEYVEMHHLELDQVRRWLTRAGIEASSHAEEQIGQLPWPGDGDKTTWLSEMRRYLGVTPAEMDALVDAVEGTWEAVERGTRDLAIEQIRALLRRVPYARRMYTEASSYYPELLTDSGAAAYPEGYPNIGRYIRSLRTESGLSEEDLAAAVGKSSGTIKKWEIGDIWPPAAAVQIIAEASPFSHDATYDELVECFTYLPRAALTFPDPRAVASFGEYIRYFTSVNQIKDADAARVLGLTRVHIGRLKKGAEIDELAMLRIYRDVLRERGVDRWNDLGEAWGLTYRMDPAGETVPDPAFFPTIHDWLTAVRLYYGMSRSDFASRIGITKNTIARRETRTTPSVVALRQLRDILEGLDEQLPGEPFTNDTLVRALQQFYARRDVGIGDEEDTRLVWDLIATRPGSPEEREIRSRLLDKYLWIAEAAPQFWTVPGEEYQDLVHRAIEAIATATSTFVPPGEFARAAMANARWAMKYNYYKQMYPNFGSKDFELIYTVDTYIRNRTDVPGSAEPDDAEISAALGLDLAAVKKAKQWAQLRKPVFLDQSNHSTDETDRDGSDDTSLVDVVAPDGTRSSSEEELLDEEFAAKLRQALPDLSEAARRAVLLYLIEDISLAEMCTRLGIGQQSAQDLIVKATESIRQLYVAERDGDSTDAPRPDPGQPGPPAEPTGDPAPGRDDRSHNDPVEDRFAPIRAALSDFPDGHIDAAEAMLAALLSTTHGRTQVRHGLFGDSGNRWVVVEVIEEFDAAFDVASEPALPVRDVPGTSTAAGRLTELLDDSAGAWGYELSHLGQHARSGHGGRRKRWFKLFESPTQHDPSTVLPDPIVRLSFARESVARGVGTSRHAAREVLIGAGWQDTDQIEDVELSVTELVTNVHVHDAGDAEVRYWLFDDVLRVEVTDESRGLPKWQPESNFAELEHTAQSSPDQGADDFDVDGFLDAIDLDALMAGRREPGMRGRGYGLLDDMAAAWGVDLARTGGKTIWFEVQRNGPPGTPQTDPGRPGAAPTAPQLSPDIRSGQVSQVHPRTEPPSDFRTTGDGTTANGTSGLGGGHGEKRPGAGNPDPDDTAAQKDPDTSVRPKVVSQAAPKQYPGTPDDALDAPPGSVARGDGGRLAVAPYAKRLPLEGPLVFHTPPGEVPGVGRGSKPEDAREGGSSARQLLTAVDPALLELVREGIASERDAAILDTGVAAEPADVARFRRLDDMLGHLDELRAVRERTEGTIAPERLRSLVHHFHATAEWLAALMDAHHATDGQVHPNLDGRQRLAAESVNRYRAADERVEQIIAALAVTPTQAQPSLGFFGLLATVDVNSVRLVREGITAQFDAVVEDTALTDVDRAHHRKLQDMLGHLDELMAAMQQTNTTAPRERLTLLVHHFNAAKEWLAASTDANNAANGQIHPDLSARLQLATEAVNRYRAADTRVTQVQAALGSPAQGDVEARQSDPVAAERGNRSPAEVAAQDGPPQTDVPRERLAAYLQLGELEAGSPEHERSAHDIARRDALAHRWLTLELGVLAFEHQLGTPDLPPATVDDLTRRLNEWRAELERARRALAPRYTDPAALRGTPPHARADSIMQTEEARLAFQVVNDRYGRQVVTIPTDMRDKALIFSRGDLTRAVGDDNLHQFTSLTEAFDLVDQMPARATAIVRSLSNFNTDNVVVLTKDSGGPVIEISPTIARLKPIERSTGAARFDSVVRKVWVALYDENGVLIPPRASNPGGGAPSTRPGAPGPTTMPPEPAHRSQQARQADAPAASRRGGAPDPRLAMFTPKEVDAAQEDRGSAQPQQVLWPEAPTDAEQAEQPRQVQWPDAGHAQPHEPAMPTEADPDQSAGAPR